MPKVTGAIAGAAMVAVLLLAGCSAQTPPAAQSAPSGGVSESAAPATVAPETDEAEGDAVEEQFLATSLVSQLELTDEEKLAAARYACDEVEAGNLDVVALDGTTEQHNRFFVLDSITYFCPDLASVYTAG